jgi:hypothetical protein
MTPAAARAMYRRQIDQHGEAVLLRRVLPAPAAPLEVQMRTRVLLSTPAELAAGVTTGDRRLLILAEDMEAAGWPSPPVKNDKVVLRGRTLNIQSVDDDKRRVAGVLIAYEIVARGAGG